VPVWLNIVKYFSAFPPIWLAAYASLGYTMHNLPLIVTVFAAINSVYSFLVSIELLHFLAVIVRAVYQRRASRALTSSTVRSGT
jgi:hypothetical protein